MLNKKFIIVILIVLALIIGFIWTKYGTFWVIDKCLDQGGRWNYEIKMCEH